jgi:hypothetical protein
LGYNPYNYDYITSLLVELQPQALRQKTPGTPRK